MTLRLNRLFAACVVALWASQASAANIPWREAPPRARAVRAKPAPDFSQLAKISMPAVVSISTMQPAEDDDDPLKKLVSPHKHDSEPQKGLGSGFFIHPDGYVLTNAHVIEGATKVTVTIRRDGKNVDVPARLMGEDELSDVALLKVDAKGPFPVLPLGDSDELTVAEWVCAIGNPFGLSHSVTVGVVSYIGRNDVAPAGRDGYYDYIQTDASINPGNSGGPLLDSTGAVIGIANAVNSVGQGIGFAIPINIAKEILGTLFDRGMVRRSWLGISVQDLSPEIARMLGLPASADGVVVSDVTDGGPGQKAGLKVGDVITDFNGTPISDAHRMRWLAAVAGVGKQVTIGVRRRAGADKVQVTMLDAPEEPPAATIHQPTDLGFMVREVDVLTARNDGLALPLGARIYKVVPGSPAERAGLRQGDVIMKVDDFQVRTPENLSGGLSRTEAGNAARLVVRRGQDTKFITLPVVEQKKAPPLNQARTPERKHPKEQ